MTDDSTAPQRPIHDKPRSGEHLARAERRLPVWLQPGSPESRWPVLIALLAAMALQRAIPERYTVMPRWPLFAMEAMLVVVLAIINPVRLTRPTRIGRIASVVLLAAITIDNTASAVVLDFNILSGQVSKDGSLLLGSGAAVFITNVIAYGVWYWEMDLGGPFARAGVTDRKPQHCYPDFMFPQTDKPHLAPDNWTPAFPDYLYVSLTNVMAFSPTDTMPLTRRAKALMTLQALVAVSTLALVFARAVNVLS